MGFQNEEAAPGYGAASDTQLPTESKSKFNTPAAKSADFVVWFLLWRFRHGFASHDDVVNAFRAHPQWLQ